MIEQDVNCWGEPPFMGVVLQFDLNLLNLKDFKIESPFQMIGHNSKYKEFTAVIATLISLIRKLSSFD